MHGVRYNGSMVSRKKTNVEKRHFARSRRSKSSNSESLNIEGSQERGMTINGGDYWRWVEERWRATPPESDTLYIYIDRGGGEEVRLIRRGETTNTLNAV